MEQLIIHVRGGVVEIANMPPNVQLVIIDYDVEGKNPEDLGEDPDGNLCGISIYELDEENNEN